MTELRSEIDLRPDLDAAARPKPSPKARPRPGGQLARPATDTADEPTLFDVADALAAITAGAGAHDALVRLAGKFASQAVPMTTAEAVILNAVDQRPEAGRDEGWKKLRGDVGRTVKWAYERFAEQEAHYAALIGSAQPHAGNGASPPPPPPPQPPPPPPGAGPSPGTPQPQPGPTGPTRAMLRNRSPRYVANVANVVTLLLQHPALSGCTAYDEMARDVELRRPLPGTSILIKPRPWTDNDTGHLQDFLQRECRMERVGRDTVHQGVEIVARMHPFHPVRDYLAAQIWDGTPRISTWLTTYLGVANSEYASATGRMWLIGLVARVMQPGCQCDSILILEGKQGALKSSTVRALCSPWTSDQALDFRRDPRITSQHMRGKWLFEMSELTVFKPADVEALKEFLARQVEDYVPRYARRAVKEPRQCGFLGTTNRQVYLADPTGARRFWPHRVGLIQLDALKRDRDQLWAEALAAYRTGEHWWPEPDLEKRVIWSEQDARYDEDPWAPLVAQYLAAVETAIKPAQAAWDQRPQPKPLRPVAQVTLIDVFRKALVDPHNPYQPELPPEKFDRRAMLRVREILENLGWQNGPRTALARWWVKP